MILTFPKSQLGPVIDVCAAPSPAGLQELLRIGRLDPGRVNFKMLVDTGADRSAVNEDILLNMGLGYSGFGWTQTLNTSGLVRRYEVMLSLFDHHKSVCWTSEALQVNARREAFEGVPYSGVIGRDVLDLALFVCDGPGHKCSLTF